MGTQSQADHPTPWIPNPQCHSLHLQIPRGMPKAQAKAKPQTLAPRNVQDHAQKGFQDNPVPYLGPHTSVSGRALFCRFWCDDRALLSFGKRGGGGGGGGLGRGWGWAGWGWGAGGVGGGG